MQFQKISLQTPTKVNRNSKAVREGTRGSSKAKLFEGMHMKLN